MSALVRYLAHCGLKEPENTTQHEYSNTHRMLSASLNRANCGVAGSAVCSDLRPNRRWRSSAFSSSRKPPLDCIFASICLSNSGSSGRFSGMGIMPWIIPNQATNRGVKTWWGRLRQRSKPSSIQLSSWTVRTIASSVTSGDVLNRSDSSRLSHRQKPLRWLVGRRSFTFSLAEPYVSLSTHTAPVARSNLISIDMPVHE